MRAGTFVWFMTISQGQEYSQVRDGLSLIYELKSHRILGWEGP